MLCLDLNEVVASQKKIQESFFIPPELRRAMKPLVDRYGGVKKKWRVYVAGLVALAEKDEAEVSRLIGEVAAADATGGFEALLAKSPASRLPEEPASPPRIVRIKGGKVILPKAEGLPDRR